MAVTGMLSRVWRPAGLWFAGALILAGCGSGGDLDRVEVADGCEVGVSTETDRAPEVSAADCDPPSSLVVVDVVEGEGGEAAAGDAVTVQYAGFHWDDGERFDASWGGGEPFEVAPLGSAGVIQGWNEGLMGAQAGDRRLLVVPPDLAYGAEGAGDAIGPDETLVFVVDVVSVG
ncbi:FKBP-type peptidyl-prolyl cis-trans isomerase [Glycomyces xiaoerkulensis]|uniref:FKBP-type peptidyl-prolyl cis-trans isomerase n=1 Tax=Glycomyces xiaoerkulensis TaxID=2038139 RepID=UPI001E449E60|nr:FKBP-type peptidyl-prolyl cis-trans isomerase [Glycomyces xiaoerkulensis]